MKNKLKIFFVLSTAFIFFQTISIDSIFAQRRDHLTEPEIELIRDEQSIEGRMEIYIKAIDRRLMVLKNETPTAKQIEKDLDKWGEMPKGTRAQLFRDIEKILEESISKVDDVAAHDSKNKLIPVAMNVLAEGANRLLPEFKTQIEKAESQNERGSMLNSIEYCNQIIEAFAKVPKLTEKERKKIKKDAQKEAEKSQQSN